MKTILVLLPALFSLACQAQLSIDSGSATDSHFTGGFATTISNPPASVTDTTARYGNFSYRFSADNAPVAVTFNWVEQTVAGPGQRLFQVKINDQIVFDRLDLYVACGYLKPCSRTVLAMAAMNTLKIEFVTQVRNAIVSSITIVPLGMTFASGQTVVVAR